MAEKNQLPPVEGTFVRGMASEDSELVRQFLAHQARIYGYIRSLVPNRADAEDLLQETGLVLLSRSEDFQPGTNFFAWACRVAFNKVLNHRTRQSRSPLRFGDAFVATMAAYGADRGESDATRYAALLQCLEKLPSQDRQLIEQCYAGETTAGQVAEQSGRSVNAIYKRLSHIRSVLRNCVGRTFAPGDQP